MRWCTSVHCGGFKLFAVFHIHPHTNGQGSHARCTSSKVFRDVSIHTYTHVLIRQQPSGVRSHDNIVHAAHNACLLWFPLVQEFQHVCCKGAATNFAALCSCPLTSGSAPELVFHFCWCIWLAWLVLSVCERKRESALVVPHGRQCYRFEKRGKVSSETVLWQ